MSLVLLLGWGSLQEDHLVRQHYTLLVLVFTWERLLKLRIELTCRVDRGSYCRAVLQMLLDTVRKLRIPAFMGLGIAGTGHSLDLDLRIVHRRSVSWQDHHVVCFFSLGREALREVLAPRRALDTVFVGHVVVHLII